MGSPPNIGGVVSGAVTEDSGVVINGAMTETANVWADTWSIQSGAAFGTATINPSTGRWTYDLDDTNAVVHALDGGQTLTDTFVVRVSDAVGADTQTITITITGVYCFAAETLIETANGPRPAAEIRVGDRVKTADHGLQPVRWVGMRRVSLAEMIATPSLQPVRISAGALGRGLPHMPLTVSRQHGIRLTLPMAELVADTSDILVPARALTGLPGICQVMPRDGITYVHLMFDRHELLTSAGVDSESFFPGEQAMAMLAPAERREVSAMMSATGAMTPARPVAKGKTLWLIVDALRRQRMQEEWIAGASAGLSSEAVK